jgi:hypothetical protein
VRQRHGPPYGAHARVPAGTEAAILGGLTAVLERSEVLGAQRYEKRLHPSSLAERPRFLGDEDGSHSGCGWFATAHCDGNLQFDLHSRSIYEESQRERRLSLAGHSCAYVRHLIYYVGNLLLLIRWSLVRFQPGEPVKSTSWF